MIDIDKLRNYFGLEKDRDIRIDKNFKVIDCQSGNAIGTIQNIDYFSIAPGYDRSFAFLNRDHWIDHSYKK